MFFKKWEIVGISGEMYLQSLCDDKNGLVIILDNELIICKIIFDSYLAYKNEDESYRLSLWSSEIWKKSRVPEWNFYTVSESEYLEEIHRQSCGIYRDSNIIHYAIYTGMDCVDILSCETDPIIEITKNNDFLP